MFPCGNIAHTVSFFFIKVEVLCDSFVCVDDDLNVYPIDSNQRHIHNPTKHLRWNILITCRFLNMPLAIWKKN